MGNKYTIEQAFKIVKDAGIAVSQTRFPWTYHHDWVLASGPVLNSMSRADVAKELRQRFKDDEDGREREAIRGALNWLGAMAMSTNRNLWDLCAWANGEESPGPQVDVSQKIAGGDYESKVPVKGSVAHRADMANLRRQFCLDLATEHGVIGHPKAQRAFDMAWERGHAEGHLQVAQEFEDLVELLKP